MNKEKAKKRIEKLKKEINLHRYNYHVLDKTTLSEAALDSLKHEIFKLEEEYPELISPDSPTQKIGGKPVEKFSKTDHFSPMLSLFDAFSEDDIYSWQKKLIRFIKKGPVIDNFTPEWSYYCELKLDGLAVNLKYYKGLLIEGSSRGDGKIGENITSNIKTIKNIPLDLVKPKKEDIERLGLDGDSILDIINSLWIEIRGEVVMKKKDLQSLNLDRQKKGEALLANTRNAAAGSLRQLDPKIAADRKLYFFAYDIILYNKGKKKLKLIISREKADKLIKMLGVKVMTESMPCKDLKQVFDFHKNWEKNRESLDVEVDGVVVKINEFKWWEVLGVIGKAPRYAMAYKFSAEQGVTKIKDVIWQVGRTGVLTPTAVLEPIRLSGALISRASLHNVDEIDRLGIKINDSIIIERSGDVIPKIVSVLKNLRTGIEQKIDTPKECPNCGGEVVKKSSEVAYRCASSNCYAVNLRKINHFVSKKALDIENLGPKIVKQLVDSGLVSDFSDLYDLKKEELLKLDRFAEKSASNLIDSIKEKQSVDLSRFIYSLGIAHVGEVSAQYLASMFYDNRSNNLKEKEVEVDELISFFKNIKKEELLNVDDFGPVIANSVYDYFNDEHNTDILLKLKRLGVKLFVKDNKSKKKSLNNKKFVITGTLISLTREQAKDKIKEGGGRVLSSVSKELDYLIAGNKPGSKYDKAKELGVKIISENDFLKIIN
jgi:DNA ligase (NAD+)